MKILEVGQVGGGENRDNNRNLAWDILNLSHLCILDSIHIIMSQ